ncbi:hypothetical protein AO262_24410 [Pseudomonas fluorescens ABAC62]|nr:hypothetical protein AO262_24410 [Pseudomonas fluorescens ABAC62]
MTQEIAMTHPPKGPSSSEHASGKDELGFDPDSPDVADPQVYKKPAAEKKPPYDPLGDLKK